MKIEARLDSEITINTLVNPSPVAAMKGKAPYAVPDVNDWCAR